MTTVELLSDDCLGLRPCFAGLQALMPRVINVCVAVTSAFIEPRTSATTTTDFSRSLRYTAFQAHRIDCRHHGRCVWACMCQRHEQQHAINSQSDGARLTVTGLRALKPTVLDVSVISTSTVIEPSTARSATTGSAGFLERAALWAHARTRDR